MKQATFMLVALSLVGCDQDPPRATKDRAPKPAASAPSATPSGSTAPAVVAPKPTAKGPFAQSDHPAMKDPSKANEKAPDTYRAKFETTVGDFTVACTRDSAPYGADRFYNLVKIGFFNDVSFFRTVRGFVTQWGIHGDPEVSKAWRTANIEPDEVKGSNKRGTLTFAQAGRPEKPGFTAKMRSTQLFINYKDNLNLDKMGFAPFCTVEGDGMSVVDKLYSGYGGRAGNDQMQIQNQGNAYLREKYPQLDYIKKAFILGDEGEEGAGGSKAEGDDAEDAAAAPSASAPVPDPAPAPAPAAPKAPVPAPAPAAPPPAPAPAPAPAKNPSVPPAAPTQ